MRALAKLVTLRCKPKGRGVEGEVYLRSRIRNRHPGNFCTLRCPCYKNGKQKSNPKIVESILHPYSMHTHAAGQGCAASSFQRPYAMSRDIFRDIKVADSKGHVLKCPGIPA